MMTTRTRSGVLGRTIVGSVKITAAEQELLRSRYGTNASGLRAALDLLLSLGVENVPGGAGGRRQVRGSRPVGGSHVHQGELGEGFAGLDGLGDDSDRPHRHRRGTKIGEEYDGGTMHVMYRCADPTCSVTLTA